MIAWKHVLRPATFEKLSAQYRSETSYGLILFSKSRIHINRCTYYPWQQADRRRVNLSLMIREALRWGEPSINLDSQGNYLWCVPICLNARVVGGVCSATPPDQQADQLEKKVGHAAWQLLNLSCEQNICNRSLMQLNREESKSDARRAEAIHSLKEHFYLDPRAIYLREEFELLSAIRHGQKEKAREIINRILVGIYHLGKDDFGVLKTLVLEMVVLMYRAAVDRGADPRELLGVNSSYLKDFHGIEDDIHLSHWLTHWLEAFISTSLEYPHITTPVSISLALEYMKNNLAHPISRDEVARLCNMSPGYFSRVFRERTGYTYSELLNKFRIEQACSLLHETDMSVYEIAFEAGFNDQSYFSKVFRRYQEKTPVEYRREGGR